MRQIQRLTEAKIEQMTIKDAIDGITCNETLRLDLIRLRDDPERYMARQLASVETARDAYKRELQKLHDMRDDLQNANASIDAYDELLRDLSRAKRQIAKRTMLEKFRAMHQQYKALEAALGLGVLDEEAIEEEDIVS